MRLDKKLFFDIHSWIGTKLSILFFIVCFSGTIATISNELDWLFIPEIRVEKIQIKKEIRKNEIVENIKQKYPNGQINYWDHKSEPYLCDIVHLQSNGKRSYVFVNPYTGKIQGSVQLTIQRFFRDLHYFLFVPFQVGHYTVLVFGFLLLFSLITALYFYKKWWKKFFEFKKNNGKLVLFRSLHRLVGLWSIPFALLFSVTGIWYFLERTNTANIEDISNPEAPKLIYERTESEENLSYKIDYDKAISIAENQIQGLNVGSILPPKTQKNTIYLTGKSDVPLVRERSNRVYINPNNYEVVKVQKANEIGTVMFINDVADPLHFGYWGGLITKLIWFLFGLAISGLVLTGIWIRLKREAIKKIKSQKPVMGVWRFINWGVFFLFLCTIVCFLITMFLLQL